ncbi:MAG TPA: phytanoyl-CoA dioxygenase family protein [Chthonomonadales bacterium]|nr:phytanoyl-CoA dioxygenase family protein [Chthonomonadales bacterium]
MNLSQSQINHFRDFGYLCARGLFNAQEMEEITRDFETAICTVGDGSRHDGSRRTMFGGPIEHSERLCSLLDDSRITALVGGLLGEDFNYCGGDGNYYSGDTPWHPDGNWGSAFALKVAFYLDPVAAGAGALTVLPGSQRPDHPIRANHIDMNRSQELYGIAPSEFPGAAALPTEPGDIVAFNHDLFHSSWGGGPRRRMFTMNCTIAYRTAAELELGRKYLSIHSAGGYNVDTGAGMYFPLMLDTANAARRRHLEQPAAIHDELFPHLARNRPALQPAL